MGHVELLLNAADQFLEYDHLAGMTQLSSKGGCDLDDGSAPPLCPSLAGRDMH